MRFFRHDNHLLWLSILAVVGVLLQRRFIVFLYLPCVKAARVRGSVGEEGQRATGVVMVGSVTIIPY